MSGEERKQEACAGVIPGTVIVCGEDENFCSLSCERLRLLDRSLVREAQTADERDTATASLFKAYDLIKRLHEFLLVESEAYGYGETQLARDAASATGSASRPQGDFAYARFRADPKRVRVSVRTVHDGLPLMRKIRATVEDRETKIAVSVVGMPKTALLDAISAAKHSGIRVDEEMELTYRHPWIKEGCKHD